MKRAVLLRLILGAILGAILAPAVVCFIGPMWVSAGAGTAAAVGSLWSTGQILLPVTPKMASAFGSVPLALTVQSLLGGLFGSVVALATLPFAEEEVELLRRSIAHFAATAVTFSLLLGVCHWVDHPKFIVLWVILLAVLYLLVWIGRWIGWYLEVVQLRSLLGLDPGPSPLHWRETLPYLPFLLLVCLLLPGLLVLADRAFSPDVPVLSQLIYPFVFLPVSGFVSGLSLAHRQGFCPLYPVAFAALSLPASLVLYHSLSLPLFLLALLPALAGNRIGKRRDSRA